MSEKENATEGESTAESESQTASYGTAPVRRSQETSEQSATKSHGTVVRYDSED